MMSVTCRSLKLQHWAAATMLAAFAVGTCACSDDGNALKAESDPAIDVKIDSKAAPAAGLCTNFVPDDSRGQLTFRKYIDVRNSGADTGNTAPLCLSWTATKVNSQFKLNVVSGATKDETACPGMSAALKIGATLKLEVEYKGNESGDTAPLTLTFTTNDPKKPSVKFCFGLALLGVVPTLQPTEYTFVNVTPANPGSQCFKLLNTGTAGLSFQGASFDPDNSQYELVKVPNSSDVIPPKGDAGNPDGNKFLEICVRYKPDNTKDNEDVTLVVDTNAKPSQVSAKISAKTEAEAVFQVDCSNATGKVAFVFPDATKKSSTCKVANSGPPPLVLKGVEVQAINAADKEAVAAAYSAKLVDIGGNPQATMAIASGKSASLVVTYTAPATGTPPAAQLVVTTSSAGAPSANLFIPIEAGGCSAPQAPQFGPAPDLWQQAKVGADKTGTIYVGNQSCAPLQLVNACIAPASYPGKDPCSAPSKNHSLVKGFTPIPVAPYSTAAIEVMFKPADSNTLTKNDLLHVFYCTGTWTGGQCSNGQVVSRSLALTGSVAIDTSPKPPTVELTVVDDPTKLALNTPIKLAIVVKDGGSFTDKTFYYRWVVAKRPEGSTTWIPEGEQTSDQTPTIKVLADVPGDYVVVGQAQGYDESNSTFAWSPQATISFTVKGP